MQVMMSIILDERRCILRILATKCCDWRMCKGNRKFERKLKYPETQGLVNVSTQLSFNFTPSPSSAINQQYKKLFSQQDFMLILFPYKNAFNPFEYLIQVQSRSLLAGMLHSFSEPDMNCMSKIQRLEIWNERSTQKRTITVNFKNIMSYFANILVWPFHLRSILSCVGCVIFVRGGGANRSTHCILFRHIPTGSILEMSRKWN